MKTLADHTIIYDDECPMCREYTQAFVKCGMLDQQGRVAYTDVAHDIPTINWNRARNEIALFNKKDHTVRYGVDSLMAIIGNSLPGLERLFRFKPFYFIVGRLYLFISYNRKVIAPGSVFEGKNACIPDLNYTYRWAYIFVAWLITSFILVQYSYLAVPLVPASDLYREFAVCGGQLVFQGSVMMLVRRDRCIHYLGNVMTISLAGALALAPMLLVSKFIVSNWFYIGYFLLVVAFMFFEHLRRTRILELSWYISATWVLYRVVVLGIILSI